MARGQSCSFALIGDGFLLRRCGELALAKGHRLACVCTANPALQQWASSAAIPTVSRVEQLPDALRDGAVDYLFSVANPTELPPPILELARRGAINFHDGPLPRYAGVNAPVWALINREPSHGVTWHLMAGQPGAGGIVKQQLFSIAPKETALTLNFKCYDAGAQSFGELLEDIASEKVIAVPQPLARSSYSRWERPSAQCTLSWRESAEDLEAVVRALDFGPYANPLGTPKILLGHELVAVRTAEAVAATPGAAVPGTVISNESQGLRVATASGDLVLSEFFGLDGQPLDLTAFAGVDEVRPGTVLPDLGSQRAAHLGALHRAAAPHEGWWSARLERLEPAEPPYIRRIRPVSARRQFATLEASFDLDALEGLSAASTAERVELVVAAFGAYLGRVRGLSEFDVGFRDQRLVTEFAAMPWFADQVPLRVRCDPSLPFSALRRAVGDAIAEVHEKGAFACDLALRVPALLEAPHTAERLRLPAAVDVSSAAGEVASPAGSQLVLQVSDDGRACGWLYDPECLSSASVGRIDEQFAVLLRAAAADPTAALEALPLLSEAERERLVRSSESSDVPATGPAAVHRTFEAQVARTPDSVALVFREERLSWRDLNAQANRLARELRRRRVQRGALVGICVERSPRMLVAVLGVLKAGAAYVPLDPRYPAQRLQFMLDDAAVSVLVSERHLAATLPASRAPVFFIDSAVEAGEDDANLPDGAADDDLAYVIYTSGSTGEPKGVMVTHANVINLFAGMDERVHSEPAGVWLAVTSLSFDISVLELLWTLSRGHAVVLHAEQPTTAMRSGAARPGNTRPLAFSLFYFASDEGSAAEKYRLLLEGARYADQHGFTAVWTPERHFHAFGGLYPNPAVTGAAVAAATTRIGIRAGSVVLPLHSPIRVAEEWAVVDNLSGGRVGISFASGWHPNDFVLRPENFQDNKRVMFRDVDVVRRLWRGEEIDFPGPGGTPVRVRTLPRPVQPELPFWITSAGSPETFRAAGEAGAAVLTHLLGQSIEDLSNRLAVYREAWQAAGHPGTGFVTLMLHTFVGADANAVRERVRAPLTEYLRSSVNLMKPFAASFPAFRRGADGSAAGPPPVDLERLSSEDMEALLGYSFERYYESSGLFGTPESCRAMIDRLTALGVDELACLIDFGVDADAVLDGLQHLNRLRELCQEPAELVSADYSLPALIRRHGVTHLQCTPSFASLLLEDDAARAALGTLQTLLVGGEAFPPALAVRLRSAVPGTICNMYGPTETTIWSATYELRGGEDTIPLGRPITNTELYVVDSRLQPVPAGVEGELLIGGAGVAAGYLRRPELTAQRFLPHPWSDRPGARVYRTGDRVRLLPDGSLEFLGRLDQQVKLGGVRIELGEVEHILGRHPSVSEVAAVIRQQDGTSRLVAYVVAAAGATLLEEDLRAFAKKRLPEPMVPTEWVMLDALPRTPGGKINRGALPTPRNIRAGLGNEYLAPRDGLERQLVRIWEHVLNRRPVGVTDDFFELGGHSLLAVSLVGAIQNVYTRRLSPVALFRAPTVAQIADTLRREFWSGSAASLVPLKPEGSRAPLFLIHWANGHVFSYRPLAAHLGDEQPVYGIQAQGLLGEQPAETNLERMAERYVREIRTVQPHGPYHLGGACFGGIVAFEMARQLRNQGEDVALLAMLHSGAPRRDDSMTSVRLLPSRIKSVVDAAIYSMQHLPRSGRVRHILRKAGQFVTGLRKLRQAAPSHTLDGSTGGPLTVKEAARIAERAYDPRVSPGRVTVFRASNWRESTSNPFADLGWGRWHAGGIEIHDAPGIELGILDEPEVRTLAELLQGCLERVTPTPPPRDPAPGTAQPHRAAVTATA